jgi:hypothetical protein
MSAYGSALCRQIITCSCSIQQRCKVESQSNKSKTKPLRDMHFASAFALTHGIGHKVYSKIATII